MHRFQLFGGWTLWWEQKSISLILLRFYAQSELFQLLLMSEQTAHAASSFRTNWTAISTKTHLYLWCDLMCWRIFLVALLCSLLHSTNTATAAVAIICRVNNKNKRLNYFLSFLKESNNYATRGGQLFCKRRFIPELWRP